MIPALREYPVCSGKHWGVDKLVFMNHLFRCNGLVRSTQGQGQCIIVPLIVILFAINAILFPHWMVNSLQSRWSHCSPWSVFMAKPRQSLQSLFVYFHGTWPNTDLGSDLDSASYHLSTIEVGKLLDLSDRQLHCLWYGAVHAPLEVTVWWRLNEIM